MGGYGYYVPTVKDHFMYETSLGVGQDRENGSVLRFDLQTEEVGAYPFDRVNITNYYVDENAIITISNINQCTYIDRYTFQDKTTKTIEIEDKSALDFLYVENQIYMFVDEIEAFYMYKVDIDLGTVDLVCDYSKWYAGEGRPVYSKYYKGSIYTVINDKLLEYSIQDDSFKDTTLPYQNAWQLLQKDHKLYISCADNYQETGANGIVIYDLDQHEIITKLPMTHAIIQFDIVEDNLYIWNWRNEVCKYQFNEKGECTLQCKTKLELDENTFIGSFYCNN